MKTTVLCFCLLIIISYGHCQISNDVDSFSMVDQFSVYNDLSHQEKLRFNKRVNEDINHYDEQDIAILIEYLGVDFYKMNDLTLKERFDDYFAKRFIPKHQYTPGHAGFDSWHDRLHAVSEQFKVNARKNKSFFPKEEIWDGLIYFDNLVIDSNWHWTNNNPACSLLWDYTNGYNSLTQQRFVHELDEIYELLDGTSNIYLRANRYLIFMRNLYSDQNWNALVFVAQRFIDDLIEESFLLQYNLTEPEVLSSESHVMFGDKLTPSYQFYVDLPATNNTNDLKEQYLTWMVATVKLLISIPHDDLSFQDHILHNFGKIAGLLDSEEELSPWRRQIQLLEIDYFRELCLINLFDEDYLSRYVDMLDAHYYKSDTVVTTPADRLGMMLRATSALGVAIEYNYSIGIEGFDNMKFKHSLASFYTSYYLDKDTSEVRLRNKKQFELLFNLANRSLVEKNYFQAQNFSYCALELIEENSEHFSLKHLNYITGVLMISYIREGNDIEAVKWADYLHIPFDLIVSSLSNRDIDSWSDKDYRDYTNMLLEAFNSETASFNEIKELSPIFIRILTEGERSFVRKKKYKKAYEILRLIGILRNQKEETLPFLDNIRYRNLTNTLSKKTEHQKSLQKKYRKSNSALITEVNRRTQNLSQLQRTINHTQHELESVQDSVIAEQKRLAKVKDSVAALRGENTKLYLDISYKDSVNRELDSSRKEEERARIQAENAEAKLLIANTGLSEKNAQLQTANYLLILLGCLLGILIILLAILGMRFRKEKNKALQQKNLTETLTLGFTQMGHFGKSLIEAFSKRHYGEKKTEEDSKNQLEKDELERIAEFLNGFSLSNVNNSVQQSIENEIKLAGEIVSLLYTEDYDKDRYKKSYTVESQLLKEKVPIYTISNLIVNSFRHSIRSCPIRFQIKVLNTNEQYATFELRDYAQKEKTLPNSPRGLGINFIRQMFEHYNEKVPTNFSIKEWKEGEESGVVARFNLKRTA